MTAATCDHKSFEGLFLTVMVGRYKQRGKNKEQAGKEFHRCKFLNIEIIRSEDCFFDKHGMLLRRNLPFEATGRMRRDSSFCVVN